MKTETQKLTERYCNEENPEEKQKIRKDLDQTPLTSGELEQVQQREVDRKKRHIEDYHNKSR